MMKKHNAAPINDSDLGLLQNNQINQQQQQTNDRIEILDANWERQARNAMHR
jgi:hypothetical protein